MSLLADAAQKQPLLCVIDDAQWLDQASAQALGVVARRLLGEPIALVVAAREPGAQLRGLPELLVGGLGEEDARDLLGTVISQPLDEQVRERFIAETRGNPLALLELPRGLAPVHLDGGLDVAAAPRLLGRLEETFRRRLEALPPAVRRLLLVAAAEPTGDPVLVWRAASLLGIGMAAAVPAEAEGLLTIGRRVIFRHPLVRSEAYRAASPPERRAAHQALAGSRRRRRPMPPQRFAKPPRRHNLIRMKQQSCQHRPRLRTTHCHKHAIHTHFQRVQNQQLHIRPRARA